MKINQNKAPHQMGHDHKLGVMPTEILWKDERTNYWKGLQGRFGFLFWIIYPFFRRG